MFWSQLVLCASRIWGVWGCWVILFIPGVLGFDQEWLSSGLECSFSGIGLAMQASRYPTPDVLGRLVHDPLNDTLRCDRSAGGMLLGKRRRNVRRLQFVAPASLILFDTITCTAGIWMLKASWWGYLHVPAAAMDSTGGVRDQYEEKGRSSGGKSGGRKRYHGRGNKTFCLFNQSGELPALRETCLVDREGPPIRICCLRG